MAKTKRAKHKHYFMLPAPAGRKSLGTCRNCKTTREHYNSAIFTSPWRGKLGNAATIQGSRMRGGINTTQRKLTPSAAEDIRRESKKGVPTRRLAEQHSVSRGVIRAIIMGRTYKE